MTIPDNIRIVAPFILVWLHWISSHLSVAHACWSQSNATCKSKKKKSINKCEGPCRSPIERIRDYCGWETKQADLVMKKQFPPKPPGTTSLFQLPHWRQLECRRISTAPAPANIMQGPLSLQGFFLEQNCYAFCPVHCSIIASPG